MIVEPTVNELLKHAENRYALVIAASKRARDIAKGEKIQDSVKDVAKDVSDQAIKSITKSIKK